MRTATLCLAVSALLTAACGDPDFGDAFGSGGLTTTAAGDGDGDDDSDGDDSDDGTTGDDPGTTGPAATTGDDGGTTSGGDDSGAGDDTTGGAMPPPTGSCGNGVIDVGEACDGDSFGMYDAEIQCLLNGYTGGSATCTPSCTVDFTTCSDTPGGSGGNPGSCGNDAVDPGEDCDGGTNGETCQSLGFDEGSLSCDNYCMFETSACQTCGDGIIGGSERCDCAGADCTDVQLGRTSCQDLTAPSGEKYTGGVLGCVETCDAFDESGCTEDPVDP